MNWTSDTEPKIVSEKGVEMGLVGLAQEITSDRESSFSNDIVQLATFVIG